MEPSSNSLTADDHTNLQALLTALPDPKTQVSLPDCNTYKTYRPILQSAIPLIAKIPIYGSKISSALSFLLTLADGVCQIPATPNLTSVEQPGSITIEKNGTNELLVTFPPGTTINSNNISQADLYLALSRNLLKPQSGANAADCIGVVGPICIID